MSRNRIKSANSLQTNKVGWIIAVPVVFFAGLMLFLCLKFNNGKLAEANKAQESELAQKKEENSKRVQLRQELIQPRELQKRLAHFNIEMVELNSLQVLDVQNLRGAGEMVARGRNYSSRTRGD